MNKAQTALRNEKMLAAYKLCGNYCEVARQFNMSDENARLVISKYGEPTKPEKKIKAAVDKVITGLSAPKIDLTKAHLNELVSVLGSDRAIAIMLQPEKFSDHVVEVAQAKMILCLHFMSADKIAQASPTALAGILPVLGDLLTGKIKLKSGKREETDPKKIIETLRLSITRIRSFNPTLADDTEAAINKLEGQSTKEMVEAVEIMGDNAQN